jgi:hypothetical protein
VNVIRGNRESTLADVLRGGAMKRPRVWRVDQDLLVGRRRCFNLSRCLSGDGREVEMGEFGNGNKWMEGEEGCCSIECR